MQTQLDLAEANGAVVRFNEAVTGFEQHGETVQVRTARATYTARQLIVAAGSWLPDLLAAGQREQFIVRRQVLYWFRAKAGELRQLSTAKLPGVCLAAAGAPGHLRLSCRGRGLRTASSLRPRNIPKRPRRNRSIAACLRRKQRRCTRPMSRLIFRRCCLSRSKRRSASIPACSTPASSSTAIRTTIASSSRRPARAMASSIRPASATCWRRWRSARRRSRSMGPLSICRSSRSGKIGVKPIAAPRPFRAR